MIETSGGGVFTIKDDTGLRDTGAVTLAADIVGSSVPVFKGLARVDIQIGRTEAFTMFRSCNKK